MPAKRILSAALALLLVAAIPARATSVPTLTVIDTINPGAGSSSAMDSSDSAALGDYLYFQADDGTHGDELWRTNGTTTTLVEDINTGSNNSNPENFAALGDYLYFQADDGTNGYELWRTNGTEAGTTLVENIRSGGAGSYPDYFTALGDYLYFQANDGTTLGLWRTDGTVTESVPFPVAGQSINCDCYEANIIAVGARLYTTVESSATGHEFAYLDEPTYVLPETNRDGSPWTVTLVILAGLTAAASIGLRVRNAKRA